MTPAVLGNVHKCCGWPCFPILVFPSWATWNTKGCNYGQAAGNFQNLTLTGVQHIFHQVKTSEHVVQSIYIERASLATYIRMTFVENPFWMFFYSFLPFRHVCTTGWRNKDKSLCGLGKESFMLTLWACSAADVWVEISHRCFDVIVACDKDYLWLFILRFFINATVSSGLDQ